MYDYLQMKCDEAEGEAASRLRQQKDDLLSRFPGIPPDALPGYLSETHRRCGKRTCHCADGKGHPVWSLTFMVDGQKRVEWIPYEWVGQIRPLVEEGRAYKSAVASVFAANAQLLALRRKQETPRRPRRR